MEETKSDAGATPAVFVGPREVKTVEAIPEKYNGTIELVNVTYVDGSTETLSKKLYDASVTPEATDLTALRDKRLQPVVMEFLRFCCHGT